MKWVIQEFLNHNESVERMRKAAIRCDLECLLVRLNRDDSLTVLDEESRLPLDDSDKREHSRTISVRRDGDCHRTEWLHRKQSEMNMSPCEVVEYQDYTHRNSILNLFQRGVS